jgi:membrane protein implicated in regulation of membrane protease activity
MVEWLSTLLTQIKGLGDFLFQPLTLLFLGVVCLALLILPTSALMWLGFATLLEQHRAVVSTAMIVLLGFGGIRTVNVYISPWREKRKEEEKKKADLKRQKENNEEIFLWMLDTFSEGELMILAYCLSQKRTALFVTDRGNDLFENSTRALRVNGIFNTSPVGTMGSRFYITKENWQLLEHFKEIILKKIEALSPGYEKQFVLLDKYQEMYGFRQVETSDQKKELSPKSESPSSYTLYTKDVFYDVIWKWHYKPEFRDMPLDLTPFCPDCERPLMTEYPWGGDLFMEPTDGGLHRYMTCSVHRKDHCFPVDRQGNYVTVIEEILNNIKTGKWKEIVKH